MAQTDLQSYLVTEKTGGLKKYQSITVGSGGLWALFRYELLTSLLGPLPGALGLILRRKHYHRLFKKIGKNGRRILYRKN